MTTDRIVSGDQIGSNYRSAVPESQLFGGPMTMNTPAGIVHTHPPPLPPRPSFGQQTNAGFGMGYSPYSNNFGNYGGGYSAGIYSGYNNYFRGGMNSGFGAYNNNPLDPENQFIQMAEENSRSTFQSIESFVNFVGNISVMFESTYFALTSSFRAILGVAANFSRLRGFFSQFFSTFGLLRGMIWLYKKFVYALGLSNIDPATVVMNEAFNQVQAGHAAEGDAFFENKPKGSGWPIMLFLGFIMSAPYLIMKLYGSVTQTAVEESKHPKKWVNPIYAVMLFDFRGDNPGELKLKAGQMIKIAPREIQQTNGLLRTSWLLASADNKTSGLIPVNYIKRVAAPQSEQQMPNEPQAQQNLDSDDKILQMDPVLNEYAAEERTQQ